MLLALINQLCSNRCKVEVILVRGRNSRKFNIQKYFEIVMHSIPFPLSVVLSCRFLV